MKLRAEPYTLELHHDIKESEKDLRSKLNLDWCDGVLFNVIVKENEPLKEYDAIIWNEKEKKILFIEYKNSLKAHKNLTEKETNTKKDYALNIARAFGFREYNFIIVVKHLEETTKKEKGKAKVISLDELNDFMHKIESFESTLIELDYVDKLLSKYNREEYPVDFKKEQVLKELKDLRNMIDQVNR